MSAKIKAVVNARRTKKQVILTSRCIGSPMYTGTKYTKLCIMQDIILQANMSANFSMFTIC